MSVTDDELIKLARIPGWEVAVRVETGERMVELCEDYWGENRGRMVTIRDQPPEMARKALHAALLVLAGEEPREVCICAAIRMPDGYIVRGHRHGHCIATASDIPRYNLVRCPHGDDQGFVTSRNRYVTREEGLALQLAAGIPSADPSRGGKYHVRQLFSEDLY